MESKQVTTYPWAGIADIQMVTTLFNGELGAGFLGDPVTERAGLALEFARLVAGLDPICDFEAGSLVAECQLLLVLVSKELWV